MKFVIIQPSTWERNLNGICYMPYWVHACLKLSGCNSEIHEDITMRSLDKIKIDGSDIVLIDISSYPQIELAESIMRDLNRQGINNVRFIGYKPLIEARKLNFFDVSHIGLNILDGVFNFQFYENDYKDSLHLLSDCDMHYKVENPKKVIPLFLSVGCKRGCSYCYVSSGTYPYGVASMEQVEKMLDFAEAKNANVHFCDEDFFLNPNIDKILASLHKRNIQWIALTETMTLKHTIDKFGEDYLIECGNFLNEVGLEVFDKDIIHKQQDVDSIKNSKLRIFWLTVALFPEDTIGNQNRLGEFLSKYGAKREELAVRIQTNSCIGGLGQFFQAYHGTKMFEEAPQRGIFLTNAATRLYPSYINNNILNYVVKINPNKGFGEAVSWLDLYMPRERALGLIKDIEGRKVSSLIEERGVDFIIVLLQLARFGLVIE